MRRCPSLISTMPTIVSKPDEHEHHRADDVARDRRTREQGHDRAGQRGHDAAEDDDRDAVADAELGDQLTHPDQQHRARRHRQQRGEGRQNRARIAEAEALDQRAVRPGPVCCENRHALTITLQQRQRNGQPVRVLVDLVAPALAFVRQLVKLRNDRRHQLHDDRRGDVWIDAERDDREVLQAVAGEDVQNPQERIALDEVLKTLSVHTGHRNRGEEAEDDQHPQREQDLRAADRES